MAHAASKPTTGRIRDLHTNGKAKIAASLMAALGFGVTVGWVPKCSDFKPAKEAAAEHAAMARESQQAHTQLRSERALIEQSVATIQSDVAEIKGDIKELLRSQRTGRVRRGKD